MIDLGGFGHQLLEGTWMTIRLALVSLPLGLALGLLGATAKLSGSRVAGAIASTYTTVIRGIPELLVVLMVYFGGAVALRAVLSRFGYTEYVEVNAFAAGVFALALTFGAYATEVFRGAFLAVPRGQIEAAYAVGMGRLLMFRRVMLPQVWRFALPGLGNLFLVLLKDTSLISVVGLDELARKSYVAAQYTKEPFKFYLAAALIYLALTAVSMVVLQRAERSASRGVARAQA